MDLILFITGIAIGLSVTAPLGPVNILVIRNAIKRGFGVALMTGLGAVAADIIYAAAAAYGISSVQHFIADYSRPLTIIGGLFLVYMGVRLARTHVRLQDLALQEPLGHRQLAGKMATTFMLTLTNPGILFGFLAIFGTMSAVLRLGDGADRPPTVVIGVALGGALWWLFISFVVHRLRSRISETVLDRINRWTGVLIAAFGFALLMDGLL